MVLDRVFKLEWNSPTIGEVDVEQKLWPLGTHRRGARSFIGQFSVAGRGLGDLSAVTTIPNNLSSQLSIDLRFSFFAYLYISSFEHQSTGKWRVYNRLRGIAAK